MTLCQQSWKQGQKRMFRISAYLKVAMGAVLCSLQEKRTRGHSLFDTNNDKLCLTIQRIKINFKDQLQHI